MYTITTYYKFTPLNDLSELKLQFTKFCNENDIKGTILFAKEGINSTIAGSRLAIDNFYTFIKQFECFADLEFKESVSECRPFKKLKIKIKEEVVTFKVPININNRGEYLKPKEWDEYLNKGNVIVIDTRNDFEVKMGTFKNAINPGIKAFTELPKWVEENLQETDKEKDILMFCTGGIRCEKSTAFMKQQGFKNVYHLEGGILKYFETTKNKNQNWRGNCFVFDDRISVSDNLTPIKPEVDVY